MLQNKDSNSIIREAKIEAKKEKLLNLFRENQKVVLAFLIIAFLFSLIFVVWLFYQESEQRKYSAILHQTLIYEQEGKLDLVQENLEKLHKSGIPSGVRSIASIRYAALMLKQNKFDEAIKIYLEINQTKSYDRFICEYAGYAALKLLIDSNNKSYEEKISKLISRLEKSDKLFKYLILEQKGIFEWSKGNFEATSQIFKNLAENPEANESVRARSEEMYKMCNSKLSDQKR